MEEKNNHESQSIKNKLNNITKRQMIAKESELLIKTILTIKKMQKLDKKIKSLPKDSSEFNKKCKKMSDHFNKITSYELKLFRSLPHISDIKIIYLRGAGFDTEETYWEY